MAEQKAAIGLELQVADTVARGVYSNVLSAMVGPHEVTLDFVYVEPHPSDPEDSQKRGYLVSRVVIGKSQLRPVVELLERQLKTFEEGEPDAVQE